MWSLKEAEHIEREDEESEGCQKEQTPVTSKFWGSDVAHGGYR